MLRLPALVIVGWMKQPEWSKALETQFAYFYYEKSCGSMPPVVKVRLVIPRD